MTTLQGKQKSQYVRQMFGRIAGRYDLLNRLMTFGQDIRWRKEVVKILNPQSGWRILDEGCGTGDLTFEILNQVSGVQVTGSDLTPEMVMIGRQRKGSGQAGWVIADASALPFSKGSFDGVISGFLLRNVPDVNRALEEQKRVLKDSGKAVNLDTTPPEGFFGPFVRLFLRLVIPLLGRVIAGDPEAYHYLPGSTEKFLSAQVLSERMRSAGFKNVNFKKLMFGSVAIHSADKTYAPR